MAETEASAARLKSLMERNAYTRIGITSAEKDEAMRLINVLPLSDVDCWVCSMSNRPQKAIDGVGLCQGHAAYALITRK